MCVCVCNDAWAEDKCTRPTTHTVRQSVNGSLTGDRPPITAGGGAVGVVGGRARHAGFLEEVGLVCGNEGGV